MDYWRSQGCSFVSFTIFIRHGKTSFFTLPTSLQNVLQAPFEGSPYFINLVHIAVRSSVLQTRLHSCSKSARTLLEFSPLSLYILKNTLSGVVSKMERETRLELATPSLARKCSTTELLSHSVIIIIHGKFYFSTILFCFLQILFHRFCL